MTWLDVRAVAQLEGRTERSVRRDAQKGKYGDGSRCVNSIGGNSGKKYEIALECLSEAAQAVYHGQVSAHDLEPIMDYMKRTTGRQREAADFKALTVEMYQGSGLSVNEFIKHFNAENPEATITKAQLFRWQSKYKSGNVADLVDLRGGHNKGQTAISDDAWDCFYSLYMTQQKRSIQLCWDLTLKEYPEIPSVSAFARKLKEIPKLAFIAYREGPKALENALPSRDIDKTAMESNDVWVSDHHQLDMFVKSEDGKRVFRPWMTTFFDERSNKIVSFVARDADANATVVKKCFRIGVEKYGLPKVVHFDNGKDYRSKNFNKDYPKSLINQLDIKAYYSKPYNAKAKPVERFFGTFSNRFCKLFPTYAGKDAKNRPECMKISNKAILEIAPTFEFFQKALSNYIDEYNNTVSAGKNMGGKCPDQVYYENLKTKRSIKDIDALRLLCGNSEERVVHKNGVSILNNTFYNETLAYHLDERVFVTYDPKNIDKVFIFDLNDNAICTAQARIKTLGGNTTEDDYIKAAKEQKAARAAYKKYKPVRTMDIHSIIARNKMQKTRFTESGQVDEIDFITPKAAENAEKLKNTDTALGIGRIDEEDSVSAILMKAFKKEA